MSSNFNWCFMHHLDLTHWSTRRWFWRGKKHWTPDMDSKGQKKKSIYIQSDWYRAKRNKPSRQDALEIPFVSSGFFHTMKLLIHAFEGLFRKDSRAAGSPDHRDTEIAVLRINNATKSWAKFETPQSRQSPKTSGSVPTYINARCTILRAHNMLTG